MLTAAYPEYLQSLSTYVRWFLRFTSCDFAREGKYRSGQPKSSIIINWRHEYCVQAQEEYANSLGANLTAVSKSLHATEFIRYDIDGAKWRDQKGFITSELLKSG